MEEEKKEGEGKGNSFRNVISAIAYTIFFVPLFTDKKKDPFVKFHVRQGLLLLIVSMILSALFRIGPFKALFGLFLFILWITGTINALMGKQKELPIIGQYANHLDF